MVPTPILSANVLGEQKKRLLGSKITGAMPTNGSILPEELDSAPEPVRRLGQSLSGQVVTMATVVTEVSSTTRIRVKESNYAGHMTVGDYRGWFNPVADGVTAYIYPN